MESICCSCWGSILYYVLDLYNVGSTKPSSGEYVLVDGTYYSLTGSGTTTPIAFTFDSNGDINSSKLESLGVSSIGYFTLDSSEYSNYFEFASLTNECETGYMLGAWQLTTKNLSDTVGKDSIKDKCLLKS